MPAAGEAQQARLEAALCSAILAATVDACQSAAPDCKHVNRWVNIDQRPMAVSEAVPAEQASSDTAAVAALLRAAGHGLASRGATRADHHAAAPCRVPPHPAHPHPARPPPPRQRGVLLRHCSSHVALAASLLGSLAGRGGAAGGALCQLCPRDMTAALQLASYLRAAMQATQRQQRAADNDPERRGGEQVLPGQGDELQGDKAIGKSQRDGIPVQADENQKQAEDLWDIASSSNTAQQEQVVEVHLELLRTLAPPATPPLPLQRGSSLWSGVPTIGAAGHSSPVQLRLVLLASLR